MQEKENKFHNQLKHQLQKQKQVLSVSEDIADMLSVVAIQSWADCLSLCLDAVKDEESRKALKEIAKERGLLKE